MSIIVRNAWVSFEEPPRDHSSYSGLPSDSNTDLSSNLDRQKWEVGDFALIDNLAVAHYAVPEVPTLSKHLPL